MLGRSLFVMDGYTAILVTSPKALEVSMTHTLHLTHTSVRDHILLPPATCTLHSEASGHNFCWSCGWILSLIGMSPCFQVPPILASGATSLTQSTDNCVRCLHNTACRLHVLMTK